MSGDANADTWALVTPDLGPTMAKCAAVAAEIAPGVVMLDQPFASNWKRGP